METNKVLWFALLCLTDSCAKIADSLSTDNLVSWPRLHDSLELCETPRIICTQHPIGKSRPIGCTFELTLFQNFAITKVVRIAPCISTPSTEPEVTYYAMIRSTLIYKF